jgi:hypothetical protein
LTGHRSCRALLFSLNRLPPASICDLVTFATREIRGARNWAKGAIAFSHLARSVQSMLVDGDVALVWAPRGRLLRVLRFTIARGKIAQVDMVADPARLSDLDLAVLNH